MSDAKRKAEALYKEDYKVFAEQREKELEKMKKDTAAWIATSKKREKEMKEYLHTETPAKREHRLRDELIDVMKVVRRELKSKHPKIGGRQTRRRRSMGVTRRRSRR
jgi:hypothetical protein